MSNATSNLPINKMKKKNSLLILTSLREVKGAKINFSKVNSNYLHIRLKTSLQRILFLKSQSSQFQGIWVMKRFK